MQFVAVSWLAYTLTDSLFWLGVASFSKQISSFVTGFFAGVIADRFNRKKLIQYAHSLIGCLSFIMAVLVVYDILSIFLLICIQLAIGVLKAVEIPSRQSFVNDLVQDSSLLSNAIALNSTIFNTARLIGPAIAGMIIPILGEESCLFFFSVMSFGVVLCLSFVDVPYDKKDKGKLRFVSEFSEGFRYAYGHPSIRVLLLFVMGIAFFGTSFIVLLPVLSDRVFDGGTIVYGYMNSAQGLGAIASGLYLAGKVQAQRMPQVIFGAAIIFLLALTIISSSSILGLTLLGIMLTGVARLGIFASTNTLLQLISNDDMRGRVLSLYMTVFTGGMTLGGISVGALADLIGIHHTFTVQLIACIALAFWYFIHMKYVDTLSIPSSA